MKKKLYIILGLVLLVAALGIAAAQYVVEVTTVAENTGEMPDFQQILTDKLLPEALRLVTEIGALLAMLWPQISAMMLTVKSACAQFGDATTGVKSVSADGAAVKNAVEANSQKTDAVLDETAALRGQVKALTRVVGLMVCGNDALVANGTARKIMEALENEEAK